MTHTWQRGDFSQSVSSVHLLCSTFTFSHPSHTSVRWNVSARRQTTSPHHPANISKQSPIVIPNSVVDPSLCILHSVDLLFVMNWLRGNNPGGSNDPDGQSDAPSSTPDANELRRRRLAKLEAAQAAEKARRKDFEDRKAKWAAEKAKDAGEAPKPKPLPTPPPTPRQIPIAQIAPKVKRARAPLPSTEEMISGLVAKVLGIAFTKITESLESPHLPEFLDQLRVDSALSADQRLVLSTDEHADDILIHRINAEQEPITYLFKCYTRCGQQSSEIHSNRRIAGDEHKSRRGQLVSAATGCERRIIVYAGMVLSGSFMDTKVDQRVTFVNALMHDHIPPGFIRALLRWHMDEDGPGMDDLWPAFTFIFKELRQKAAEDMKISLGSFYNPIKGLATLLTHKELCRHLAADRSFNPKLPSATPAVQLAAFSAVSYLFPFFRISALPGLPLNQPTQFPEDPSIARNMFPNPTMLNRTEAEGTMYSLRSSLSLARSYHHQVCMLLCKAGPKPREAMLAWFGTVCNLNAKRTAMHPDPREISRDGFIWNVMHVLLKMCEPIVAGGWKLLQKVDPTFPQSKHRINYEEETRLAADTDMLKRWWVDKRNPNAQESLTRQLELTARESGMAVDGGAGPSSAGASASTVAQDAIPKEYNFVTECFWLALRFIQLGFVSVVNMYDETLLRSLHRLKEIVGDMEAAKEQGPLPPDQEMQLSVFKARFEGLLQAKLCYDVYIQDRDFLTSLVQFVTADAEWLMKKLLSQPARESLLPLPLPPDPLFASLPEHTVENIVTVLLTTMRFDPRIVDDNSALLDDMVSFCIAGSASPLHLKNPYLRAKLIEFLWTIVPRGNVIDDDDEDNQGQSNPPMEALFAGHQLSRKFLPASLFRLYVDVEHTGSHTQFHDKFSIRYRIGSILESLWHMSDYRRAVRAEARDETRFLRFVNMVLNDANHLLDNALDDLEEMHGLETLINGNSEEWQGLTEEEKSEKKDRLQKLEGSVKSYNQLGNNNVKLLWLLTDDEVVRKIFLRDEMVSRVAEMLNYLLVRLSGQRCSDLVVSNPEKVYWKPKLLLTRIMSTYIHFHSDKEFATAVARDGRSYKRDLFANACRIAKSRRLLSPADVQKLEDIAAAAYRAHEEHNEEEDDLGEIPDDFLDPVMSSLMRNPMKLPTSGNVMDKAVISRILLSDKSDPFNRKFLTEDMLEEDVELKKRIEAFIAERRALARAARRQAGQ